MKKASIVVTIIAASVVGLDMIKYKDYSKCGTPLTQEFILDMDETYRDVRDPKSVIPLPIGKVLMKTTIGQPANIKPAELFSKYGMNGAALGKFGLG